MSVDVFRKLGSQIGGAFAALRIRRGDFLIALVVTIGGFILFDYVGLAESGKVGFAFVQNIELRSLDARFRLRGARPVDPRIAIVGIDEKTLHEVGAFPIPRDAYARLIERLNEAGAREIAFDMDFPTPEKNSAVEALKKLQTDIGPHPSPQVLDKIRAIERSSDNDAIFAAAVKKAGNVVLGHIFLDAERAKAMDAQAGEDYYNVLWAKPFPQIIKVERPKRDFNLAEAWVKGGGRVMSGIEPNIGLLAGAAQSYGFFNDEPDADGVYRRSILVMRYLDREWYPSLAFQTVREFEHIPDQAIVGYIAETGMERIEFGGHHLKPWSDGSVLINFAGPYGTYPQYSMSDVIDGKVPPQAFQGKIVLVGATALGIGDLRPTPYQSSNYMGVEIHANIIDNLLHSAEPSRTFLVRGFNEEMIDIAFILVFGMGLGFVFGRVQPLAATISVVVALVGFGAITYWAFARHGLWLSFVVPASVLIVNYGAITSFRMIFEEKEKRKIRKSFSAYVSPAVIKLIEQDPGKFLRLGGEMRELSVMFCDIRSFTTISEGMTPNELVQLLNEYLGEMTEIIFRWWGTLDKYIGDAIMAFWGSPIPQEDHAYRACTCALDMGERLEEMNREWERQGRKWLNIGIGVNTAPVNVGNLGSDKRLAWSVLGDGVNLASRLEGMTKAYHVRIIIGEGTYEQIKGAYVTRELDRIRVKGKLRPVSIYELMGFLKDKGQYIDLLMRWDAALVAYKSQDWAAAVEKFEDVLERYPEDGPSQTMLERCHEFLTTAPVEGWDGVYVMKTK